MFCKLPQFVKLSLLAGCLLTLFLILAPRARAQSTTVDKPSGEISGTVLLEADNRAAEGVIVSVKSLSGGPFASVLSDYDGRFQVRRLPPGTYEIAADEPGFESTRKTAEVNGAAANVVLYLRLPGALVASQKHYTVSVREMTIDRKSTRLNSSHSRASRMPSSA